MDVSNLLSPDEPVANHSKPPTPIQDPNHYRQYNTRRSASTNVAEHRYAPSSVHPADPLSNADRRSQPNVAPMSPIPKNVAFELHLDGAPNYRARLPMRVQIFPHDTTDSIITTVKNFYGLYDGAAKGVSFEDDQGNTLIATYENFMNNMIVYVRVIRDHSPRPEYEGQFAYKSTSPQRLSRFDEAPQMLSPHPAQILHYGQPPSRPGSRLSRKQSTSPNLGGKRSISAPKIRSRSGVKSHGSSFQANLDEVKNDALNGYSSSDGGAGSVTSSRKAKSEHLASAEISVDNIVEGGRRKRAKFESSELPLFVPPQVPAPNSISSISPQRRSNGQDVASPFARPTQRTFTYSVPLQSPQGYTPNDYAQGSMGMATPFSIPPTIQHGHRLRDRTNALHLSSRSSSSAFLRPIGSGILPTPDPTIASCISDEDVALQLMRLGDASNISHGRTSASTLDDAFSGRADAASSMTSDSENDSETTEPSYLPMNDFSAMKQDDESSHADARRPSQLPDENIPSRDSTEPSGDEVDGDYEDRILKSEPEQTSQVGQLVKSKLPKLKTASGSINKARAGSAGGSSVRSFKVSKQRLVGGVKKGRPSPLAINPQPPISPASLPAPSRKTSSASTLNFQHQLGADEDDLSSKPRCQRCRKSKKGCDRQRPCQRCKDAGIGIEGCVSEDEGNGRKGRYGRHMGVPVKKGGEGQTPSNELPIASPALTEVAGGPGNPEKSKKRKR